MKGLGQPMMDHNSKINILSDKGIHKQRIQKPDDTNTNGGEPNNP